MGKLDEIHINDVLFNQPGINFISKEDYAYFIGMIADTNIVNDNALICKFKSFLIERYINKNVIVSDDVDENINCIINLFDFLVSIDVVIDKKCFDNLLLYDCVLGLVDNIILDDENVSLLDNKCAVNFIKYYINKNKFNDGENYYLDSNFSLVHLYLSDMTNVLCNDKNYDELDRRILNGDEAARREYFYRNLKMVYSIAKRFKSGFQDLNDLIQIGNMGLLKACQNYDPTRGIKFSTYAYRCIYTYILLERKKYEHLVSIPIHKLDSISVMNGFINSFVNEHGVQPTNLELANLMNCPVSKIETLRNINLNIKSLNEVLDEQGNEVGDYINDDSIDVEEMCIDNEMVREALSILNESELEVILYRFGFVDGIPRSLKEIEEILGHKVSHQRICQVSKQALSKMKKHFGLIPKKK